MEPEKKQGLKAGQRNGKGKLGMGSRTEGWRYNKGHKYNDRKRGGRGKEGWRAAQRDGERKRQMGSGAEKWRKKIQ